MALFRFQFLRRLIRRHTNPIPEQRAGLWKRRLSVLYMVFGWNAFGFMCYAFYNGKADWAKYYGLKTEEELRMTSAQQWSKTLGIKNAQVISISGFDVTSYEIKENEKNEEQMVQ